MNGVGGDYPAQELRKNLNTPTSQETLCEVRENLQRSESEAQKKPNSTYHHRLRYDSGNPQRKENRESSNH